MGVLQTEIEKTQRTLAHTLSTSEGTRARGRCTVTRRVRTEPNVMYLQTTHNRIEGVVSESNSTHDARSNYSRLVTYPTIRGYNSAHTLTQLYNTRPVISTSAPGLVHSALCHVSTVSQQSLCSRLQYITRASDCLHSSSRSSWKVKTLS